MTWTIVQTAGVRVIGGWLISPLIKIENWCDFVNNPFDLWMLINFFTDESKIIGIKMGLSPQTLSFFLSYLFYQHFFHFSFPLITRLNITIRETQAWLLFFELSFTYVCLRESWQLRKVMATWRQRGPGFSSHPVLIKYGAVSTKRAAGGGCVGKRHSFQMFL